MHLVSVIIVNWYSGNYIKTLLDNLKNKAKSPEEIRVIIIDNTNGKDASVREIVPHELEVTIHKLDSKGLRSSRGHSFGLNYSMKFIDTEFALIVDPDVHVFKKSWEQFCIGELSKNNCIAIGAPYPFWKTGKYHNFPSPIFCFFRTKDMLEMECDWTAHSQHWWQNSSKFLIRQIGRLGGFIRRKRLEKSQFLRNLSEKMEKSFGVFSQDTGWRIAQEAAGKDLKTIRFQVITRPESELDVSAMPASACQGLAKHYELYGYDGQAILTHKYSTGVRSWKTEKGTDQQYWRECIREMEEALNKEDKA